MEIAAVENVVVLMVDHRIVVDRIQFVGDHFFCAQDRIVYRTHRI